MWECDCEDERQTIDTDVKQYHRDIDLRYAPKALLRGGDSTRLYL